MEVLTFEHRPGQNDEDRQRRHLHHDQNGVEARAFLGADNQEDCDKPGDHCRGKVKYSRPQMVPPQGQEGR